MVIGQEIARMVEEFEMQVFRGEATYVDPHERLSSFQVTFFTQVNELVAAMAEMGQLVCLLLTRNISGVQKLSAQ
jgi:hypothetical protein